ncbi:hypothetical protein J1N35_040664 [Gossypium stocksii]|uniref:Uncharacterized protein n=1 Tax=Gossypium stocksii TaxID=47602 RepID=A0A9D3ZIH5_9ROSI|nr:hypothetical protein J1N35_040664 [Gossypium stocksii]
MPIKWTKNIVKDSGCNGSNNILEKIDRIYETLGPWQYNKFNRMRHQIDKLTKHIDETIDAQNANANFKKLKDTCINLGKLYEVNKGYWTQRSRINWLIKGDRNTIFFHVRATSRQEKNNIDRLKYHNRIWVSNTLDKCRVARDYFYNLFITSNATNDDVDVSYILNCVNQDMNKMLMQRFIDEEILHAFNQMDPRKAPDIDDLLGIFLKKTGRSWVRIFFSVVMIFKDISCINETIDVLIPKIKDLSKSVEEEPLP